MLLGDAKEDLNKWRTIIVIFNIIEILALSKFIYGLSAIQFKSPKGNFGDLKEKQILKSA